nr:growth hormone secretagogue receptor type 1-like [Halyomorpha halys]
MIRGLLPLNIYSKFIEKSFVSGKAVPFVELTVAHASVLTILAISFERYYAICQPLRAGYVCTKARAMLICLIAWAFAALFTSPVLMVSEFREEEYFDGTNVTTCLMEANEFWTSFYFTMSTTVFFCLPLAILVGLYTVIARNLLSNHGLVAPNNQSAALRYRRQVVMMLGTVVISFFICLLPFKAFTLYVIYAPPEILLSMGIETFYNILYICRMMFYINSAINPILYNLMSSKFRDGFRKLLGISNHGNFARKGTVTTTTTLTSSAKTSSSDNLLRRSVVRVISLDEASRVDNGLSTTIKLLNNSIVRSDESYV